jgi:hypothetical protein
VQAQQQVDERRLAHAGSTHDRDHRARRRFEGDAAQHRFAAVREGDVAQPDALADAVERYRVRRIADVDRVVEDLEEALGRRQGVQQPYPTLGRGPHGLVDGDHDEDEGGQLAERDPAPDDHRDADEQHGDRGGVIQQLHQGARQQAVLDHLHGAAEEAVGRPPEGLALEAFGPERLD